MRCAVFGCNVDSQAKNYKDGVKFFRFPTEPQMCKAWQNACCRKFPFSVVNTRICSRHFKDTDYVRNLRHELLGYKPTGCRLIKEGTIPTENLPNRLPSSTIATDSSISTRHEQIDKTNSLHMFAEVVKQEIQIEYRDDCDRNDNGTNDVDPLDSNDNDTSNVNPLAISNIGLLLSIRPKTEVDNAHDIAKLKIKIAELESESDVLKKLFTSEQIKRLKHPQGRPQWSFDDVSNAIAIHSAGPQAYRLLLRKGYPFPAVSTLRSWLKNHNVLPGILKPVFNIIKQKEMNEMQKVCILSFDEMKLSNSYLYENYAQVVMLRGLFSNWIQPIFYDYDYKMTKNLLFDIINYVENSGFHVVGVVGNLDGGNQSLRNELEITSEKTWFKNPANNHKIYVFADVPNLMTLIRNNFIESGFIINGKEINKNIIENLLDITGADLSIGHKISRSSLNMKNVGRHKIELATKLFSRTIFSTISRCGMYGQLGGDNWLQSAEVFKVVNDWFDCLNVRVQGVDNQEGKKAYGLCLDLQKDVVNKMTDVMQYLRVKGKRSLLPFQTDIIMTNKSLELLFEDVKKRFGAKYILTSKLNQDALENFFGVIRGKDAHGYLSAEVFTSRLTSYVLGRNKGSASAYDNVEDNTSELLIPELASEENLGAQCFIGLLDVATLNKAEEMQGELKKLEDGLEKQPDAICDRLEESNNFTVTNDHTYSCVQNLSESGLTKPSTEFNNKNPPDSSRIKKRKL